VDGSVRDSRGRTMVDGDGEMPSGDLFLPDIVGRNS
jgi:hypothetical protein